MYHIISDTVIHVSLSSHCQKQRHSKQDVPERLKNTSVQAHLPAGHI